MRQTVLLELVGLMALGAGLMAAAGYLVYSNFRKRPSPVELERRRCRGVGSWGKIHDAVIVEWQDNIVHYYYEVRGVEYAASQDLSTLLDRLPDERGSLVGAVSIKYDPRNPANSIILGEQWSGLRKVR